MARKKKTKENNSVTNSEVPSVQTGYMEELESNPEYSLEVDPENKYNLPPSHKDFIKAYINYKSIYTAAEMAGIEKEGALQLYNSYPIQMEIRRINRALYHRQFASKILSLDQLGGYLSSIITDNYVPLASQLKSKDKLKAIELLLKISDLKTQSMNNPAVIIEKDISSQLKDLSISAIQKLIEQSNNKNEKTELIEKMDPDNNLTMEEKSYLETLSTEELLTLIDDKNKGDNNE